MTPSMYLSKRDESQLLLAFTKELERLGLTLKLGARLAGVTPQAIYAWQNVPQRRMRRKSGAQLRAATRAMRECKHLQRTELIWALKNGNMEPFNRLRERTLWFTLLAEAE